MKLTPQVSYAHTLSEISVNRADPCELVRELISNSYDAGASQLRAYALTESRGLLFFDDGSGLSRDERDAKNGVLPYVAFFSIGKGTKTRGEGLGYKCQGSKLCFAARRFLVITRTSSDDGWYAKVIDNPKSNLREDLDVTPSRVDEPWKFLTDHLPAAGAKTKAVLSTLDKAFFEQEFRHGTLILMEDIETDEYEQYFSTSAPDRNYLYQYIRLHTAHGDCRRIRRAQGFSAIDVDAVKKTLPDPRERRLRLWCSEPSPGLIEVPSGWMYLDTGDAGFDASPAEVNQLRSGRFFARYATTFKHGDEFFNIILAVDGNRRALDRYTGLARRGSSNSGLRLSHTRGVLLSSRGVVVCNYPQLWNLAGLSNSDFAILADGQDHYTLIVDGPFDLVTNRDGPAPSAQLLLKDARFAQSIDKALKDFARRKKDGLILEELVQRLGRESTRHREDSYVSANDEVKQGLAGRRTFHVDDVSELQGKLFLEPERGEEHFVGALYTLFAHLVGAESDTKAYWPRPLTFSSRGIDAIALCDERAPMTNGNVISLEYKHSFASGDEFNHPLSITDTIVCWELDEPNRGDIVRDSYNYLAKVGDPIEAGAKRLGFVLTGVRHQNELKELAHEVTVLSLKRLLEATFAVRFTNAAPPPRRRPRSRRH